VVDWLKMAYTGVSRRDLRPTLDLQVDMFEIFNSLVATTVIKIRAISMSVQ